MMFHNLCHQTDEHGNTKNRVCPECDTAFKVPIGLKHHLLLHTGELPFLCLHCWRSFSSHIDLKLHIRKEHLSHLEPPTPPAKVRTPRSSAATASRRTPKRTPKMESVNAVTLQQHQLTEQQLVAAVQAATGGELGDNVQVVVANQEGEDDNQTILVNSDGTIVQTGDQDMIVVIQGDEDQEQVQQQVQQAQQQLAAANQQQQLIVLEPNQLQQVTNADGTVTLVESGGGAESGQTMVLSEGEAARILQLAGGSNLPEGSQVILTQSEDGTEAAEGVRYILSGQQADGGEGDTTTTTTTTLVMEEASGDQNGEAEAVHMIVSDEPSAILSDQVEDNAASASAVDTKEGLLQKKDAAEEEGGAQQEGEEEAA